MSRLSARTLVLALILAAPVASAAPAPDSGGGIELLCSARMWEANSRPDLARVALEKYLLAWPDDTQALVMLGELEVRSGHADVVAKLLDRLRAAHPDNPAARDLESAYRVATRDRLKLATINRLMDINKPAEAVKALRELFPDGPPGGEIGIEYYRILSGSDANRAEADAGFRRLFMQHPGDGLYELALADHLRGREQTRVEGLRRLRALASRTDIDHQKLMDSWRNGVSRLPPTAASVPLVREYLAEAPDDAEIRQQLVRVHQAEQERARRAADPVLQLLARGLDDLDAGRLTAADAALSQAQRQRPGDGPIMGALGRLRLREGRDAEAEDLFRQAAKRDAQSRRKWTSLATTAQFWKLLGEASALRDSGDSDAADARIQAALKLQPQQPDALAALAASEQKRGHAVQAEALYRRALQGDPANGSALRGLFYLLMNGGRDAQALALLDSQRASHPEFASRFDEQRAGLLRDQADAAIAAGHTGEGLRLLEAAQALAPANPWIRFDLAKLYRQLGLPDEARSLMAEGVAVAPDDPAARYADALLLASLDQDADALTQLRLIPQAARSNSMDQLESRLLASQWRHDLDTRLDRARALRERGQREAALAVLDQVLQRAAADDVDTRLAVARQRLALDDLAGARAVVQALLEAGETAPLLVQDGRIDLAQHRYSAAMERFRRALALERGASQLDAAALPDQPDHGLALSYSPVLLDDASDLVASNDSSVRSNGLRLTPTLARPQTLPPTAAEQEIASLEQRRHGFIAVAPSILDKPGDPGISKYSARELSIEARIAQGYDGHWFALVDPVKADAGTLPAVYDSAALFGKVQAFGPSALSGFPGGVAQSQSGTAVGLGYESDDLRVDLGTTPIGFDVEDIVGGLKYDGRAGLLNYTLDLSRRPLTSSLLTYAGARDPVTGQVWGGIRASGLDARLAYYGERFSASASAGLHRLTGREVPGNNDLSARLAGDWRLFDAPDMRFYAGLSLTWWSYGQNLSQYSFGQGGYYSPQSYVSLALPLEWTGRRGDWSYRLRGSLSLSHTTENDSPFYPGDSALQAAALTMPLPSGYSQPVYSGSSGSGHGYSLAGAVEYRLLPRWFLGGHFDIDRSAYYAPNLLSAYLRYDFDLQTGPVVFPPRAPRSYSQF